MLYSTYYATFAEFKHGISFVFDHTDSVFQPELRSLLTLKFQAFKQSDIMTV